MPEPHPGPLTRAASARKTQTQSTTMTTAYTISPKQTIACAATTAHKKRQPASRPLIYCAYDRYAGIREYTSKSAAIRAAKSEAADGWPAWVEDMRTGELVWQIH